MSSDIRKFRESERSGHRRISDLSVIVGFLDDDLPPATDALTGATTAQISVIEWLRDTPGSNAFFAGDWNAATNSPTLLSGSGIAGSWYEIGTPNVPTALDGAINNSVTSINVADATLLPTVLPFDIEVDIEQMTVTAISGNTLTVTRGVNGTTAASHADTRAVAFVLDDVSDFRAGQRIQFDGAIWKLVASEWYETGEKAIVTNRDTTRGACTDYRVTAANVGGEFLKIDASCGPERNT